VPSGSRNSRSNAFVIRVEHPLDARIAQYMERQGLNNRSDLWKRALIEFLDREERDSRSSASKPVAAAS
jgi:metal-responsive CopG/Arc/MetJ family transcriptional regulator